MKKLFSSLLLAFMALGVVCFSACSGSDDDGPASPSTPGTDTPGEVKTDSTDAQKGSQEQMQQLISTSNKFMSKINSADFNNVKRVTDALENIDNDEIIDWIEDCIDVYVNGDNDRASVERPLWRASNFTGHFRQSGNRIVKENGTYDDIQVTFTDTNGSTCVAKVTTSGSTTNVSAAFLNFTEEDWSYFDGYTETRYENTFAVPQNVVATLTQNGSEILRVTVNATFSGPGKFPTQASLTNLTTTVKINNYAVTVNRAAASSSQVNGDVSVAVNNETILHVTGTANGSYHDNEYDAVDIDFGAVDVTSDILGEVQVAFLSTNITRFFEQIEFFDEDMTRSQMESAVNSLNSLSTGRLYFNKNTVPSATLSFSASHIGDYNYGSGYGDFDYYNLMPVLKFASDGQEVAFEDYFTESNFRSVINTYNNLVSSFRRMFDL